VAKISDQAIKKIECSSHVVKSEAIVKVYLSQNSSHHVMYVRSLKKKKKHSGKNITNVHITKWPLSHKHKKIVDKKLLVLRRYFGKNNNHTP
jgi:hypothetical protein